MLDLIASDLWYVSLIRLIDVESMAPYWAASASLKGGRAITVMGPMPDATLAALARHALQTPSFDTSDTTPILDLLAMDLLRLLLHRPRQLNLSLSSKSLPLWSATAWLLGKQTVTVVGYTPDEALRNLVAQAPRPYSN